MKKLLFIGLVACAVLVCTAQVVQQSADIKIVNNDNQVKFSAVSGTNQTNPWLEFGSQTNTAFSLPASGIVPEIYGGTGTNSLAAFANTLGLVGTATNGIVPVANGGTGSSTAATARTALGIGSGMTTNINVVFTATGVTNQLRFSNGILTNCVPQ